MVTHITDKLGEYVRFCAASNIERSRANDAKIDFVFEPIMYLSQGMTIIGDCFFQIVQFTIRSGQRSEILKSIISCQVTITVGDCTITIEGAR